MSVYPSYVFVNFKKSCNLVNKSPWISIGNSIEKTGCQTDKDTKKDRNIYYIFVKKEGYTVTVLRYKEIN